jgi:hypothetical protein
MAVDSRGSKGEPQFLDGGAPDLAVDANAISDYAAANGNYRVGTRSQRDTFTAAGSAWVGLRWYDTTDASTYAYLGAAGWKRDSGYILQSFFVPWTGDTYIFGGTGTPNQRFTEGFVTDPGRPYRVQLNARCELGSGDAGTRYDLAVGFGGNSGNYPYGTLLDFAQGYKGTIRQLRVDAAPSQVTFTGTTRVVVQGNLVEGTSLGQLNAPNRSFQVTVWAA